MYYLGTTLLCISIIFCQLPSMVSAACLDTNPSYSGYFVKDSVQDETVYEDECSGNDLIEYSCNGNVDDYMAYWRLDSNADDETGVYNGVLSGNPVFEGAGFRQGLTFNGVDQYANLGESNKNDFNFLGSFSISLWIKTNSDNPGSDDKEAVLSKGSVSGATYTQFNLGFTQPENGGDDLFFKVSNGTDLVYSSTPDFVKGTWYHIVAVYDGAHVMLYKNGILDPGSIQEFTGPINPSQNADLFIGADPAVGGRFFFNGSIDEVMIYRRNLQENEIKKIFCTQGGNADFCPVVDNSQVEQRVINCNRCDDGVCFLRCETNADCGDPVIDRICQDGDVYEQITTPTCDVVPGECSDEVTSSLVQDCDTLECSAGRCVIPCSDDADCSSLTDLCGEGKCNTDLNECYIDFAPEDTLCRASSGDSCDLDDFCTGDSEICEDDFLSDGSSCTDDGIACTIDSCNSGVCSHIADSSVCGPGQFCEPIETGCKDYYPPGTVLAFPGAEGFGALASGGRGGIVLHVTRLDDYNPYKPYYEEPVVGTLRWALQEFDEPRIIVFDVGGIVDLKTQLVINYENGDYTLAGQTAPGGITINGGQFQAAGYSYEPSNFIIRHIRVRGTGNWEDKGDESDGIMLDGENFILDHISVNGACDEQIGSRSTNYTIQWSTIEEGSYYSQNDCRHSEGNHNYGSLEGYQWDSVLSLHHNIYANNKKRLPLVSLTDEGAGADIRNCIAYNWVEGAHKVGNSHSAEGYASYNLVNNLCIPGPSTSLEHYRSCLAIPAGGSTYYPTDLIGNRNYLTLDPDGAFQDRYDDPIRSTLGTDYFYSDIPFSAPPVVTEDAGDAYQSVLDLAGAWPRDATTRRTTKEIATRTGGQSVRGPYERFPTKNSPTHIDNDRDRDGMPDSWESAHGLDPDNPEDRNNIVPEGVSARHKNYTYIEYYLNELADAIVGAQNNVYEITAEVSPPESGFVTSEFSHPIHYNKPDDFDLIQFTTEEYNENSLVVMNARPRKGYRFARWEGIPVDGLTGNQVSFPATKDVTVTAQFVALDEKDVEVTSVNGNVFGNGMHYEGDVVTLAAYADSGFKFKNWSGGPIDGLVHPVVQFAANNDYQITAIFETGSGGDVLIDDFNDQDFVSFLLTPSEEYKTWDSHRLEFHEIALGNYSVKSNDNGAVSLKLGAGANEHNDESLEVRIPDGTTIIKMKVYNIDESPAAVLETGTNLKYQDIRVVAQEESASGDITHWKSKYNFYTNPFRFPVIQPDSYEIVEFPIGFIRSIDNPKTIERDIYDSLQPGDDIRTLGFGYLVREVFSTKVAVDDVAFGTAGVDYEDFENLPPVADAGRDQTIQDLDGDGVERIILNGLGSHDRNAGIIRYEWKIDGQLISEDDNYLPTREYSPVVMLTTGVHDIELTVTDMDGASSSDTVQVTVFNDTDNTPSLPCIIEGLQVLTSEHGDFQCWEIDMNGNSQIELSDIIGAMQSIMTR